MGNAAWKNTGALDAVSWEFNCACDQVRRDTDAGGRRSSEKRLKSELLPSSNLNLEKKKTSCFLRNTVCRLAYISELMLERMTKILRGLAAEKP